jgi:hypothetical protein
VFIRLQEWVATVEGDYLRDFVAHGGAAVKFAVVPSPSAAAHLRAELERVARAAGCQFATLDAAATKLHMIDALFFAVARQIDWDRLAAAVVRRLLTQHGFVAPPEGECLEYGAIARLNQYDESELRRDVRLMLTSRVLRNYAMAQEFRIAMLRLCQAQLEPAEDQQADAKAIKEWLRGELRTIAALKPALIFQRIARHNARHMLLSLAHWLRLAGCQGLVLTLDVDRYLADRWPAAANRDGSLYHTTTAVLDVYEVLRQFVDATDELEGCFIAVIAPPAFLEDPKRGLHRYDPLKLRIWDEVHDRRRANPLASLVRLTAS